MGALPTMKRSRFHRLIETRPELSTAMIRWMVSAVFLSEGIQKWLEPGVRGEGRFEKIGLPWPEFLGYFVGTTEIFCGALLLLGILVRLAAIPLLVIMGVAVFSTKLPILLDDGFWEAAHAVRTDFCMTIGIIFILLKGAGKWSMDSRYGPKGGSS